jgi:hypothetical protein
MAKFTLIEQPAPGDEIPDPATNPPRIPGDDLLLIERVVVDRNGRQRGTLTVRGTIVRDLGGGNALWSFQGNINLKKGVINTQGGFRFSDLANGVTFAIVGGTRKYKRAHGTVTALRPTPNNPVELTFRVS